jgi:hypothetical protein
MDKQSKRLATSRPGNQLPTKELARRFNVKEQTPRAALCRFGNYLGMIPRKLPNGRLSWSEEDADRLLFGEELQ